MFEDRFKVSYRLRKFYQKIFQKHKMRSASDYENDPQKCSNIIYDALSSNSPTMIARFGSTELGCMVNYIGVKGNNHSYFKYITGKAIPWWWNSKVLINMKEQSGFFPPTIPLIEQFCSLMIEDIALVDVLGSWVENEKYFDEELEGVKKVWLDFLTPFFCENPWTKILENKKVLVVHPFGETIQKQYLKRELLFKNELILPKFYLKTVKAVQSSVNEVVPFSNWFDALDFMKNEIDKVDYDICLIGAGAYGFPLAAHVKRKGKQAVHIGGALQLLFGIKGKRWENPNLNKEYSFASLINDNWVRPSEEERPKNATILEGACYW